MEISYLENWLGKKKFEFDSMVKEIALYQTHISMSYISNSSNFPTCIAPPSFFYFHKSLCTLSTKCNNVYTCLNYHSPFYIFLIRAKPCGCIHKLLFPQLFSTQWSAILQKPSHVHEPFYKQKPKYMLR